MDAMKINTSTLDEGPKYCDIWASMVFYYKFPSRNVLKILYVSFLLKISMKILTGSNSTLNKRPHFQIEHLKTELTYLTSNHTHSTGD